MAVIYVRDCDISPSFKNKTKQTKKTRSNLFKGNVLQSNTSIISRFTPAKASRQTLYALNDDEIILNIIRLQARCLALIWKTVTEG